MKRPPLPGAPGAMLGAAPAAHWLAGTARGLRGVLDGFASVAGAARRTAELPALDWAEPALAPDGLHLPDLPERGEPAAQEATQGRGGAKPSAGPVVPSPSGAGNLPPVAP
ncbi:MAG TPA: hypothetical protein VNT75_29515, partial [Symbiobacteriaceae bacterium]|nr:hypothetical protein [Symbiobacteriaceae bacterium]